MIEKALQFLVKTAQAATAPTLVCEDDRTARYDAGGTIVVVPKAPALANHHVRSLEDLVAVVLAFDEYYGEPSRWSVWHAPDQVIGVFDNGDRRDVVRFRLTFAESFAALVALECEKPVYIQSDFIHLLDVILGVDKAIIAPFRKLDWRTQIQASGEVAAGRDRMGKEITAEVAGVSALPNDLLIQTAVYREKGERCLLPMGVRCVIRTHPANERIAIRPVPGEIDTAIELAQGSIRQRLEELLPEGAAIFYGSP